jgi:hypothetical protein
MFSAQNYPGFELYSKSEKKSLTGAARQRQNVMRLMLRSPRTVNNVFWVFVVFFEHTTLFVSPEFAEGSKKSIFPHK